MSEIKHFNAGNVFGKIVEAKEEKTDNNKRYLVLSVDVSGAKSGRVTAYCRLWDNDHSRADEFLNEWRRFPAELFWFKGFLGQYTSQKSGEVLNNFTVFQWERKQAEKRAVFILKGKVSHQPSRLNDGGQRFLLLVRREGTNGNPQEETFELWAPGDKLLDPVSLGDVVEVKGLVRQKEVEDFYGSSDGPIRAYVDLLKIIPQQASIEEDLPY